MIGPGNDRSFPASGPASSSVICLFLKRGSDHINLLLKILPESPVTHLLKCRPFSEGLEKVPVQRTPGSHFHPYFPSRALESKSSTGLDYMLFLAKALIVPLAFAQAYFICTSTHSFPQSTWKLQ